MGRPEIGGIVYIGREVTERRQFEAQVHQAQKMESIRSLAGGVAHDLAAPNRAADLQARNETIVVVDDEPAIRNLLLRMLGKRGYRMHEAPSAAEALALIRGLGGKVDLLLTDVMLPVTTGVQLAESVNAEFPTIKILFMSGYDESGSRVVGASARLGGLVRKPFDPPALLRKVRSVLDE